MKIISVLNNKFELQNFERYKKGFLNKVFDGFTLHFARQKDDVVISAIVTECIDGNICAKITDGFAHFMRMLETAKSVAVTFFINRMTFQIQHNALRYLVEHNLFDVLIKNPMYSVS